MHSISVFLQTPWKYRNLLTQVTLREIATRYKGLSLGIIWSFIHPLLLMGIYYFVFGLIFKPRWPQAEGARGEFMLILFLGIIIYDVCATALTKGPQLITNQVSYVKKVIFPLEIISWSTLGSTLFFFLQAAALWVLIAFAFGVIQAASLLYFIPLVFCMTGYYLMLTWFLSAIGVFIRDIAQIMQPFSMFVLFLTPIFYPLSAVPEDLRFVFIFNPLAFMVESARNVLLFHQSPQWGMYCTYTALGWLGAFGAFLFFNRCKDQFADCM